MYVVGMESNNEQLDLKAERAVHCVVQTTVRDKWYAITI